MHVGFRLPIRSLALVLILALAYAPVSALAVNTVTICGETIPVDTRELYLRDKVTGNLAPLVELKQLRMLFLENVPADDLSPLSALPLTNVVLHNTNVSDLTPLSSLRSLRELFLRDCPVADLTPIANLHELDSLDLVGTLVTDLTLPATLPKLARLYVGGAHAPPLTPIRDSETLRSLTLVGEGYNPLPVDDMPPVSTLGIRNSAINDLSALRSLPDMLTTLELENIQVTDLSPIAGLKLTALTLYRCPVSDLAPLASVPTLESLGLHDLPALADIEALLSPLRGNTALRLLSISDEGTIAMDAVASLLPNLTQLYLLDCMPERLAALADLDYLHTLSLCNCELTAQEELASMRQLRFLALYGNTGITQSQVDALQEALPTCTISYRESLHAPAYSALQDLLPDTLYYNSKGGRFFHANANCPSVAPKYLPLKSLEKVRLGDSPFYHLMPCQMCLTQ